MKFMTLLLAFSCYIALVQCSLDGLPVHAGVGGLYRGPNAETIIKGPDGSVITAQEQGGLVAQQGLSEPIVVADDVEIESLQPVERVTPTATSPILNSSPKVNVAPADAAILSATPLAAASPPAAPEATLVTTVPVAHTVDIIQPDPHIIETEIVDAPEIEPQQSSDLVGPSGSISIRGSTSIVSGPASTTISEPAKVLVAAVPILSTVTTPLRVSPAINVDLGASIDPSAISTVTVAPSIISASSFPPILVSTVAPPTVLENEAISLPVSVGTLIPVQGIASTTSIPPQVWEAGNNVDQGLSITTTSNKIPANVGVSIQPASSNGVVTNPLNSLQVSSTPQPGIILSTTLKPPVTSTQRLGIISSTSDTSLDFINNKQLSINPSLIPSANIIPPEIGPLPPGAIDLGSTITVSSTPNPPLSVATTESPNIQRIHNENTPSQYSDIRIDGRVSSLQTSTVQVDGRINNLEANQVTVQNQIVFSDGSNGIASTHIPSSIQLLRETNPIPVDIPRDGIIGKKLSKYGIDSSQIRLANIPFYSVTPLPHTLDQEIDEVSAQLWNRYGRDVEEKK